MVEKQQLLANEVFSPQITKFRRERIMPLYKDKTWLTEMLDKSSQSKYNNNYRFFYLLETYSQNKHGLFH